MNANIRKGKMKIFAKNVVYDISSKLNDIIEHEIMWKVNELSMFTDLGIETDEDVKELYRRLVKYVVYELKKRDSEYVGWQPAAILTDEMLARMGMVRTYVEHVNFGKCRVDVNTHADSIKGE